MQELFKMGVVLLFFQVVAFGLSHALGLSDLAFFNAALVGFFFALMLIFKKEARREKYIPADLAMSYAFGVMALNGLVEDAIILLVFGLILSLLRCVIVGLTLKKSLEKPEPFWHGFLGALPLGIGVAYSFAVMWHRAGLPKQH